MIIKKVCIISFFFSHMVPDVFFNYLREVLAGAVSHSRCCPDLITSRHIYLIIG